MTPETERRLFAMLLAALLAVSVLFLLAPGLDIATSRLFFDAASGAFAADGKAPVEMLRKAIWGASVALLVFAVVVLIGSLALHRPRVAGMPARGWAFVVLLYALGPGLLVELLLKSRWGRARPAQVSEFGGQASFTPPWLPADECARNCSFVAGEAAGATALALSLIVYLCWQRGWMAPGLRRTLTALATLLPLIAGAQRLAAGRHFLSDVLYAWTLIALVALAIAHVLRPLPPPVDKAGDSP